MTWKDLKDLQERVGWPDSANIYIQVSPDRLTPVDYYNFVHEIVVPRDLKQLWHKVIITPE